MYMRSQPNIQKLMEYSIGIDSEALSRFLFCLCLSEGVDAVYAQRDFFSSNKYTRLAFKVLFGELISRTDFGPRGLVFEDFPVLKKYFQDNGNDFYSTIDVSEITENLRFNISVTAELLQNTKHKSIGSFAFLGEELHSRDVAENIKIIGITKVKNEGGLTSLALDSWMDFCDQIIVSDASDKPCLNDLAEFGDRVTVINQISPYHEKVVYDQLFAVARQQKATHILHFDVDEIPDENLKPDNVRLYASKMSAGEALAVSWPQIFKKNQNYLEEHFGTQFNYCSHRLFPPFKDLIFCDDGLSSHRDMPIHNPWITEEFPSKRFFISGGLLHLQGLCNENIVRKINNYWRADFSANKNLELALGRYTPEYLKFKITRGSSYGSKPAINISHSKLKRYEEALREISHMQQHSNNGKRGYETKNITGALDKFFKNFEILADQFVG
jgi:hypothetical protein